LGWALENIGATSAMHAQEAYRKALGLQPDDPFAHKGLANALRIAGDRDAAAAEYGHALALFRKRPQDQDFLPQEGWCLYSLGDYHNAIDHLRRATSQKADLSDYLDLALCLLCADRRAEGRAAYYEAIERVVQVDVRHQRGLLHVASEDLREALEEGRISVENSEVAEVLEMLEDALSRVRQEV
jgi:Flp pilus assembly protein TadD